MFLPIAAYGIYLVGLVTKWLRQEFGSLQSVLEHNRRKAEMLYREIDDSDGFFVGHAHASSRSFMNVTFRLPNADLEARFLQQAEEHSLSGLKGHRSIGGLRASIYNAVPLQAVEALCEFMRGFRLAH